MSERCYTQNTNDFNLSRYIPSQIKKKVRKRCNFGCIICGCMLYEYHHFDPPFHKCKKHIASGITLLCGSHHDEASRGFLSEEMIYEANKLPYAKKNNAWHNCHLGKTYPIVWLGNNSITNCQTIIQIHKKTILRIDLPKRPNSPFLLSAYITNSSMKEILVIEENEIKTSSSCWDIEVKKGRYKIFVKNNNNKEIAIEFSVNELPNKIVFNQLNMSYEKHHITIQDNAFSYNKPKGNRIIMNNCHASFQSLKNSYALKVKKNGSYKLFGS